MALIKVKDTKNDKNNNVNKSAQTVVKFVVGAHSCPVSPEYRTDQHGCEEWMMNADIDVKGDFEAFVAAEYGDVESVLDHSAHVDSFSGNGKKVKSDVFGSTASNNKDDDDLDEKEKQSSSTTSTPKPVRKSGENEIENSQHKFVGLVTETLNVKVLHGVIIKRLGILASIGLSEQPIAVSLFKDDDEYETVSVEFSLADHGVIHKGYRYQPITPVTFTRGSLLEISVAKEDIVDVVTKKSGQKIETKTETGQTVFSLTADVLAVNFVSNSTPHNSVVISHHVETVTGPGAILVTGVRKDGTTIKMPDTNINNTSLFSFLSFMYALENPNKFLDHSQQKQRAQADWQKSVDKENADLQSEEKQFGDILFVDEVDVYRSLPSKLLHCHQWFAENFNTSHILKTDDDAYIAIDEITNTLSSQPLSGDQWWGNFRQGWVVQRSGKWREDDYSPSMYPPFACGSGNVVSSKIHQWLASNTDSLFRYQGEDVSMAIWLTAVGVMLAQDDRWQCAKTCQESLLSLPDLTPAEMLALWQRRQKCSKLCSDC
jgi:beta-1,3-N-acetylgalactosaminyltransferase 2